MNEKYPGITESARPPGWPGWALAGGALCALAPLLVFITSSLRYLADATPLLTCLAAVGFWWGLWFFRDRPWLRGALLLMGCALMLASVLASLVVVFNSGDMRFEAIQPDTYARFAALLHRHR